MFAGWVNLPVDKLPPTMRGHTCAATMAAWGRVADVAREYFAQVRLAALDEAAGVAERWIKSDYDESANTMAQNIVDDIDALKEQRS
jgi:hypothetical protein